MKTLRLFAKKDIKVVDNYIKAGEEVRIGKISPSKHFLMIICKEDNLHIWISMDEYDSTIEAKFVDE